MPIIRRKLDPNDVYSETIRYNEDTDTVQSLVNGDWVDNPAADPRTQTIFPPRVTSDPTCDAAESVKDAFKRQIDGILTLISGSQTAFTIAGALLALFEFGPWGVLIVIALAIAHTMLDAGTAALTAAMTDENYEKFKCILYCHMDGSGRVKTGEFSAIEDDVGSKIGGLAADILNAMLLLAGEGGVNNLASIGTSTGDCSDCDCNPCSNIDAWSVIGGTEIARTDSYIDAAPLHIGSIYDLQMWTGSGNIDVCCVVRVQVLTGAITSMAAQLCHETTPVAFTNGQSIHVLEVDSDSPYTVRVHFTEG